MRGPVMAAAVVCLAVGCATTKEGGGAAKETFAAQAEAGAKLYGANCASCHGAAGEGGDGPRVVGLKEGALPLEPPKDRQKRKNRFVTVADVAEFVVANMPPSGDKLAENDYWRILAFDLKANGIDLGDKHLDMELAKSLTIPR